MFTGIVQGVGNIVRLVPQQGDLRVHVQCKDLDWQQVGLGDSIATNGVCLTAVELNADGFVADVSNETLSLTTVGEWQMGDPVNLELALTPQSRLGGHIVSGHVDDVGEVLSRITDARSERFRLKAPQAIAKYIAQKGSITVDGTSLTVNRVEGCEFELNIVPHTLQNTVIGHYQPGTRVNLEVDVIARYLERLLMAENTHGTESPIDRAFLADNGYI